MSKVPISPYARYKDKLNHKQIFVDGESFGWLTYPTMKGNATIKTKTSTKAIDTAAVIAIISFSGFWDRHKIIYVLIKQQNLKF